MVLCFGAGKVTSHRGHIQIQIGSSWGKVERVNGQEVASLLPHSAATNISLPERAYGGLLLRQAGDRAEAFLPQGAEASPVQALHAHYVETERAAACRHMPPCPWQLHMFLTSTAAFSRAYASSHALTQIVTRWLCCLGCLCAQHCGTHACHRMTAACRALEAGCEMLPGSYRLLPLPPVEVYKQSGDAGIRTTSIFAAQLRDPTDAFAVGALGCWVPITELLRQVGAHCCCTRTESECWGLQSRLESPCTQQLAAAVAV